MLHVSADGKRKSIRAGSSAMFTAIRRGSFIAISTI
jgi:hypothetical protein